MTNFFSLPLAGTFHRSLKAIGRKVYEIEHIPTRHKRMLEERGKVILAQLLTLGLLVIVVWPIVNTIDAMTGGDFFKYEYLVWEIPEREHLAKFWPLLLWLMFLITIGDHQVRSSHLDGKLLTTGLISGNLAGIWEELGFRYLFICFTMIGLSVTNWIMDSWLGWPFVALVGVGVISAWVDDKHDLIAELEGTIFFIGMIWAMGHTDPWFWFYQEKLMPFLNWLFMSNLEPVFNGHHDPLVVMGAVLANFRFRDGHKYQGIVGFLDSWVIGFVFMYAMFTYGLFTAMALHCLWNSIYYTSRYAKRKFYGETLVLSTSP